MQQFFYYLQINYFTRRLIAVLMHILFMLEDNKMTQGCLAAKTLQ